MGLLGLGAVLLAVVFLCRRSEGGVGGRLRRLPWVYAVFGVFYCGFVVLSMCCFDRMTPLSDRILAPAYVAWLATLLGMWSCAWRPRPGPWPLRLTVLGTWLALAALQVFAGVDFARFEHGRTRRSASSWNAWETRLIESLPRDGVIYSNRPEDFYIYVDRIVKELPSPIDVWSGLPAPGYQGRLDAVVEELRRSQGVLVLLGTSNQPWLTPDQFPRGVPLARVRDYGKIHIYRLRESTP
jgi:hypothetical protein